VAEGVMDMLLFNLLEVKIYSKWQQHFATIFCHASAAGFN
jgi:hypothetical protein